MVYLSCRSNSQFYSCLDCKMKWSPLLTCGCCTTRQLKLTVNVYLLIFQMVCTWIHGCLVGIAIGEQFSYFWINTFLRRGEALEAALMMITMAAMMVIILSIGLNFLCWHDLFLHACSSKI